MINMIIDYNLSDNYSDLTMDYSEHESIYDY